MPLKAPAEKAILGANQFKFQLTQDRKACAALTSLAVHEIAGLIICSYCPSNPTPGYTHTHTHTHTHTNAAPVFLSPVRGGSYFRFLLKAIECDNRSLYCKCLGCIFNLRPNDPEAQFTSVHVYLFHMDTNIDTILYIQKRLSNCFQSSNTYSLTDIE